MVGSLFSNCSNTKQQGNIGIASAILHFTTKGQVVCLPLNDSQDFDFVVDTEDGLKKVQVKTTKFKRNNIFAVCLKSSGGTKGKVYHTVAEGSCDLLFILSENGEKYLIPREVFSTRKTQLNLTDKLSCFKV